MFCVPVAPSFECLILFAAQDGGSDFELEDLVGAFVNAADTDVLQVPAGTIQRRPATAAENLNRAIGGIPGSIGCEQLRLRSQHIRAAPQRRVAELLLAVVLGRGSAEHD